MNEDELYVKNVIRPLEKIVKDQRVKVLKNKKIINDEKILLNKLEKELLSKYIYLEKLINNKINVK
jgi:hypothetical protein